MCLVEGRCISPNRLVFSDRNRQIEDPLQVNRVGEFAENFNRTTGIQSRSENYPNVDSIILPVMFPLELKSSIEGEEVA